MNLARRKNVDELLDFRRAFDDMFNRFLRKSSQEGSGRSAAEIASIPSVEAWLDNQNKDYHISIALPGVDPNEIQLNLEGNSLTVRGEHKADQERSGNDYAVREFSYERFERTLPLPEGIDTSKVEAHYDNGILEVTIPTAESALPKQIPIKAVSKGSESKATGSRAADQKASEFKTKGTAA
jgi:HSP20 family protein